MDAQQVKYTTAGDYWNRGKEARAIVVARALYEANLWDGQKVIIIHEPAHVFNLVFGLTQAPITSLAAGTDYEILQ